MSVFLWWGNCSWVVKQLFFCGEATAFLWQIDYFFLKRALFPFCWSDYFFCWSDCSLSDSRFFLFGRLTAFFGSCDFSFGRGLPFPFNKAFSPLWQSIRFSFMKQSFPFTEVAGFFINACATSRTFLCIHHIPVVLWFLYWQIIYGYIPVRKDRASCSLPAATIISGLLEVCQHLSFDADCVTVRHMIQQVGDA